jgi:bifunctional non-homologous end joining protein LigD
MHRKILWAGNTEESKATTPAPSALLIVPQLCNPVDETEVERLLRDDAFGMQEKKDGKHIMLHAADGVVRATNKKGSVCGIPNSYVVAVKDVELSLFDGEGIGDMFHAFDLLELEGEDLRGLGYEERYNRLRSLENRLGDGNNAVRIVPLATGYKAKKALYDRMVAEKKEGVVFKRLDAPFKAGRPSSGGAMLKFKFYAEASVRVRTGRVGKRSVGLEILNGDSVWEDVGNVTIPPNKEIPNVGDVVEIKYLYVQGVGGHLYQPIYKEVRDDIDERECTVKQLKYKSEESDG